MTRKIIPGLYQLEIPIPNNPLGCTNDYLIQVGDLSDWNAQAEGFILIDTGWNSDTAFNSLGRELAAIGATYRDIKQIIVTHAHSDHYGLADRVRQASGAKIALHRRDAELLESRYSMTDESLRQNEEWFRANGVPVSESSLPRMSSGGNKPAAAPPQPDLLLKGGETLTNGSVSLKVIWTPGHSPGHICLYEEERKLLFAGDHVLPVITPNISLATGSDANPLGDFIKSLHALRHLEVTYILPAHENIFSDLAKRVDEILKHHETRNSEIIRALDSRPLTAYEVSHVITWMPEFGGVKFDDLLPWDQRAAVSETLAHLRAMDVDGKVTSTRRDGIIYYHRKK
jgi:glyoxylase-like metal-dependent hydrolase (beta-lactamase superfamily II)